MDSTFAASGGAARLTFLPRSLLAVSIVPHLADRRGAVATPQPPPCSLQSENRLLSARPFKLFGWDECGNRAPVPGDDRRLAFLGSRQKVRESISGLLCTFASDATHFEGRYGTVQQSSSTRACSWNTDTDAFRRSARPSAARQLVALGSADSDSREPTAFASPFGSLRSPISHQRGMCVSRKRRITRRCRSDWQEEVRRNRERDGSARACVPACARRSLGETQRVEPPVGRRGR